MSDCTAQNLPGFDLKALVIKSDDIADLSDEKEYTAERLLVCHPDRYEIARRMFFEAGVSKRGVCDICKISSRTLNALIDRELKTRGAEFLYEKVRRKRALITLQLTEQLEELASDPNACKKAGIAVLVQAIRLIQDQNSRTIDVQPSSNTSDKQTSDGIEYARIYRMNGLDSEKKSARVFDVEETENGEPTAEPATHETTDSLGCGSILLSDDCKDLHGIHDDVDKQDDKNNRLSAGDSAETDQPSTEPADPCG